MEECGKIQAKSPIFFIFPPSSSVLFRMAIEWQKNCMFWIVIKSVFAIGTNTV